MPKAIRIPGGEPRGIQLRRTAGFNLQVTSHAANGLPAIKVDRTTAWGNPYQEATAQASVDRFRAALQAWPADRLEEYIAPLRGKNLACWCNYGQPCHRDVLLDLAKLQPDPPMPTAYRVTGETGKHSNQQAQFTDLTGHRLGMITVIRFSHRDAKNTVWLCRCDCGKELELRSDKVRIWRHCGCQAGPRRATDEELAARHIPAGAIKDPTRAEVMAKGVDLEAAERKSALQMAARGDSWREIAEYLETDIPTAKTKIEAWKQTQQ